MMSTDRIEKSMVLRAPQSRVWRALTDSGEFGRWFGARFEGSFAPGASLRGELVGTVVDEEIAAEQRNYAHVPIDVVVEQMEPERLFSFRWHPFATDPGVDYSQEQMTLVVFTLEEVSEGVRLTVTESGFDQIPIERRAAAFSANEGGWEIMVSILARYLDGEQ
jgi:uncharacterized protein YndB with AHSA1/START domain